MSDDVTPRVIHRTLGEPPRKVRKEGELITIEEMLNELHDKVEWWKSQAEYFAGLAWKEGTNRAAAEAELLMLKRELRKLAEDD